jgi:ABC-type lipopolysaccharide export system ATPase subunit
MKDLVVLGGPNGAGKTTAAQIVVPDKLGIAEFVNAAIPKWLCAAIGLVCETCRDIIFRSQNSRLSMTTVLIILY